MRVVKKPTSGWVEKTYQQTILKDKKVADLRYVCCGLPCTGLQRNDASLQRVDLL